MMPPSDPRASEPGQEGPFAATEALYDPESIRLLYARGLDEGWRCLEVGGGGGSIAKWFIQRVGQYGHVVVTDVDLSAMTGLEAPTLEIDRHDIVADPVPERVFHLVHARLVLGDLPERDLALQKLVATVRSDGWLMVEELDRASLSPETDDPAAAALFNQVIAALLESLRAKGLDPDYGRRIYRRVLALGLTHAVARGSSGVDAGGTLGATVLRQEIAQRRDDLLASGFVTSEDLSGFDALMADPSFAFMSATMVTTWARRPSPF